MSINQISDLIITLASVAMVVIVAFYTKHKTEIDRKAAEGDKMAKSQQMVAQIMEPLVFQAEKEGGTGVEKFTRVMNYAFDILDLAHLPHPTDAFMSGELEKGVTVMKKAQGLIDALNDKNTTTGTTINIAKKDDTNA